MDRFIEFAGRIGSQRHLIAIRDGFIAIMPLIIVGSFAIIINNFPPLGNFNLVEYLNQLFGKDNWQQIGNVIWYGTFAIIGILITFSVAYHLAKSYTIDGLSAGFIAISSYIIFVPSTHDGGLDFTWLGAQGLFVGILIALTVTELFRMMMKRNLFVIKMPKGVPSGVAKSFSALIPTAVILTCIGIIQACIHIYGGTSVFEFIFEIIQRPLQGIGNTLPAATLIAFTTHLLWFFGLHGTNILGGVIEPLYLPLIEENIRLFNSGVSPFDVPYIVTKPFLDTFVHMGGSGTTFALLIAIFISTRFDTSNPYREVAKIGAPSSLFNINEPIVFGLPIVLNPIFLLPFVLVPVILTIVSYFAISYGLVPKTVAIVHWTTPPLLSGYLVSGGSWQGVLLQLVNLSIAVIIYIPFVLIGYRTIKEKL